MAELSCSSRSSRSSHHGMLAIWTPAAAPPTGSKGGRRDRSKLRTTLLRWQVLATTGDVSLIVANPRGGHKHQVRAMLAGRVAHCR